MNHVSVKLVVDPPLTPHPPTLKQVESSYIAHVLNIHKGNITRAAEALGVTRRTLQRKLSRGLDMSSQRTVNMVQWCSEG